MNGDEGEKNGRLPYQLFGRFCHRFALTRATHDVPLVDRSVLLTKLMYDGERQMRLTFPSHSLLLT